MYRVEALDVLVLVRRGVWACCRRRARRRRAIARLGAPKVNEDVHHVLVGDLSAH